MRFRFARRPASTLLCLQFVALSSVAVSAPVTPAKSAVPAFCDTWSKLANIDETHAGIMLVKCPRPAAPDAWCGSVEQMPNPNAALRRVYLQRCLIRTRNVNAITDDSGEVEQSVPLGGALCPCRRSVRSRPSFTPHSSVRPRGAPLIRISRKRPAATNPIWSLLGCLPSTLRTRQRPRRAGPQEPASRTGAAERRKRLPLSVVDRLVLRGPDHARARRKDHRQCQAGRPVDARRLLRLQQDGECYAGADNADPAADGRGRRRARGRTDDHDPRIRLYRRVQRQPRQVGRCPTAHHGRVSTGSLDEETSE